MIDKTISSLREELVGKEFAYLSKYGGTVFGKVTKINVVNNVGTDEETSRKIKVALSNRTTKVKINESDLSEIKVTRKWWGTSPSIFIVSENGNSYELGKDEIYFIDGKNTEITE